VSADAAFEPCWGCAALVERSDGPTHRYIGASPGCWAIYGSILISEFAAASKRGQMLVDAYAAQHPGLPGPQSSQSVAVHLMSLSAQLERGLAPQHATPRMQAYLRSPHGGRRTFAWLEPPPSLGTLTVLDLLPATDAADFQARVERWARDVWDAWSPYHRQIHTWLAE
jgi:hypothetical protein